MWEICFIISSMVNGLFVTGVVMIPFLRWASARTIIAPAVGGGFCAFLLLPPFILNDDESAIFYLWGWIASMLAAAVVGKFDASEMFTRAVSAGLIGFLLGGMVVGLGSNIIRDGFLDGVTELHSVLPSSILGLSC